MYDWIENTIFSSVALIRQKMLPEQIELECKRLESELRYHPLDLSLTFKLGIACIKAKKFEYALACFLDAKAKDPSGKSLPNLNLFIGISLLMTGGILESLDYFTAHKKSRSRRFEGYLLSGIANYLLKDISNALEDLKTAIQLERNGFSSLLTRGRIFEVEHREDDAIKDYRAILESDPKNRNAAKRIWVIKEIQRNTDRILRRKSQPELLGWRQVA